jgi:glycosyltransferase involved in cell wall biosynthesis
LGHPAGTLERAAARRTPLFAANSAGAARFLTETLGVDRARVRIVPNGVEIPSPSGGRDAWRARLGAGPSDFVASMIANLHDNKDHATLLKAWRLAVDRAPLRDGRPLLALAGRPGGREDRLRALALELALGDSVRFLGSVEDVAGLLGASDLAVLSSRSEGCPNGVLEPMAAGLPVAGTDVPGIRGALGPEGSRLLAPPGDAPSLADRIVEAASDPALRADLGAAGRRRIETAFSPRRMCSAMTDLLAGGPAAA